MHPNFSPLDLISTHLIDLSVKTHMPDLDKSALIDIDMRNYPVSIDFDFFDAEQEPNSFLIALTLKVNARSNKQMGYVIKLKANYIFKLDAAGLSDKEYQNLKTLSSLSMVIAKLRNELAYATMSYQFGSYYLPALDMNDLILKKQQQIKRMKK